MENTNQESEKTDQQKEKRTPYDIFVSYAWVDNKKKLLGLPKGWVTHLVEILENHLAQIFGRDDTYQLWMDTRKDREQARLEDDIIPKVKDSATLLMILSPGYLQSEWCREELKAFLETFPPVDNRQNLKRVFIVQKTDRGALPPSLKGCFSYKFWYEDENKRVRTWGLPKFNPDETEYYFKVQDIAYDLVNEIDRIKGENS